MNIFKYRRLALGCAAFLISLYVSYYFNNALRTVFAAVPFCVLAVFIVIYVIKKNDADLKRIIKYAPLCLLLTLSMIISIFSFGASERNTELCDGKEHEISATVDDIIFVSSYSEIYVVNVKTIDGEPRKMKLLLGSANDGAVGEGNASVLPDISDTVTSIAVFSRIEESSFGFDEASYYRANGIELSAEFSEYVTYPNEKMEFQKLFKGINKKLDNLLAKNLNSDTYPVISALLLGNRQNLGDSVKRDFSRLGISHILAISGMHLTIIVTLIGAILSLLKTNKALKTLIILLSVAFFVCLTGFSESVTRAAVMLFIYYIFSLFGERTDSISVLFVSVTLICIFSPSSVFSVSLALSFLSMLACICTSKLVFGRKFIYKIKFRPLRYAVKTFILTICVNLAILPLTCLFFGSVSLISPLTNIIMIPLFEILISLAPFVILFAYVPFLSEIAVGVCEFLTKIILKITSEIAYLRGITMSLDGGIQIAGIVMIALSLCLLLVLDKKKLKYTFALVMTGITVFCTGSIGDYVERATVPSVTVYNKDKSDIIATESEGALIITDVTSGDWCNVINSYYLCSYLGYSEIEYYVVCDYGERTSVSVDRVSNKTYVRNILLPKPMDEDEREAYEEICLMATKKRIGVSFIEDEMTLCGAKFELCVDEKLSRSVKRTVCFSMVLNNSRFSYLGASSYNLVDYFPEDIAYSADILVLGSYGPNRKTDFYYYAPNTDYVLFLGDSCYYANAQMIYEIRDKLITPEYPVTFKIK